MQSDLSKFISQKLERGRDINAIRHRTSMRVRDLRRSRRSAVLNGFRQVVDTKKEPKKKIKTAAEEKLERLQEYKKEKLKRMEEMKKKQRPPFHNIVLSRHTGSTPFRKAGLHTKKEPIVQKPLLLPTNSNTTNAVHKSVAPGAKSVYNLRTAYKKDNKKPILNEKPKAVGLSVVAKSNKPGISAAKKPPVKQVEPKKTERKVGKENVPEPKKTERKPPKENVTVNNKAGNKTEKENVNKKQLRPEPMKKNLIPPVVKNKMQIEEKAVSGKRVLRSKENASAKGNIITNTGVNAPDVKKSIRNLAVKIAPPTRKLRSRPNSQEASIPTTRSQTDSCRGKEEPKEENMIDAGTIDQTRLAEDEVHAVVVIEEVEDKNSTNFHRKRLQNTIDRLNIKADYWDKKKEEVMPEQIRDEILAVVGQTKLLIAQRFRKFRGLIDRCDTAQEQCLKVTLEDLDGYWEVMYQQVDQLDDKYRNLEELERNTWEDKTSVNKPKKAIKKAAPKKVSNKPTASRFKEFLRAKQNKGEEPSTLIAAPVTPSKSEQNHNEAQSSLYMSASKGEELEFGNTNLAALKTPTRTPAVQRVLDNSRRRSSMALLTVSQTHLMKLPSP